MTKDIQVLKFAVRRNGVRFGPGLPAGAILYDLPAAEANKLIAESNGTIVELQKREAVEQKVAAAAAAAGGDAGKPKPLERMNKEELKAYAAGHGFNLGDAETKAEIIAAIQAIQAVPASAGGLGDIDPNSLIGK